MNYSQRQLIIPYKGSPLSLRSQTAQREWSGWRLGYGASISWKSSTMRQDEELAEGVGDADDHALPSRLAHSHTPKRLTIPPSLSPHPPFPPTLALSLPPASLYLLSLALSRVFSSLWCTPSRSPSLSCSRSCFRSCSLGLSPF